MKERITITTQLIDESTIKVCSDCTIFCEQSLVQVSAGDLLSLLNQAKKHAKKHSIRVFGASRLKEIINGMAKELDVENSHYLSTFNALRAGWTTKLEKGLFVGCASDEELKSLSTLSTALTKALWHSSPLGKALDIQSSLNGLLQLVPSEDTVRRTYYL